MLVEFICTEEYCALNQSKLYSSRVEKCLNFAATLNDYVQCFQYLRRRVFFLFVKIQNTIAVVTFKVIHAARPDTRDQSLALPTTYLAEEFFAPAARTV